MKPLLFLGLLAAIGSAGLAFMVRSSLKETRDLKDTQNRKTLAIHDKVREVIKSITERNEEATSTNTNAKNEQLSTKSLKSEIKAKQDETEGVKKETESLIAQKQQIQDEINQILQGAGGTPEEIAAKIETLKTQNDAKVQEIEQVTKELEVAKKAASENDQQLSRLRQAQTDRTRKLVLASRPGTITAVNPDYGFVVISSGQNQGVSSESNLIVKRGAQFIGKLKVIQISANQTVADIVPSSITPGYAVQPGDEVIFDSGAS